MRDETPVSEKRYDQKYYRLLLQVGRALGFDGSKDYGSSEVVATITRLTAELEEIKKPDVCQGCAEYKIEMEDLRAKLAAAEKDTARVDWLDEKALSIVMNDPEPGVTIEWHIIGTLRAAIDEAREE